MHTTTHERWLTIRVQLGDIGELVERIELIELFELVELSSIQYNTNNFVFLPASLSLSFSCPPLMLYYILQYPIMYRNIQCSLNIVVVMLLVYCLFLLLGIHIIGLLTGVTHPSTTRARSMQSFRTKSCS